MGSFNMFCAVSNAPIHWNDRIVVLGLDTEPTYMRRIHEESRENIVCLWPRCGFRIAGLPIRGKYDDYGGIEIDAGQDDRIQMLIRFSYYHGRYGEKVEEELYLSDGDHPEEIHTNNYPLMFIHEQIYDYICTRPLRESYEIKWEDDRLNRWEVTKNSPKYEGTDLSETLHEEFLLKDAWKEAFLGSGETYGFPHDSWMHHYAPDEELGRTYYNEVRPVLDYSQTFGYRIAPSLYAGQMAMAEDRTEINKIVNEISKRYREYIGEDDED